MPELIKAGNLYIAQPPLFKFKKGHTEVYLKDSRALQDYFIQSSLEGTVIHSNNEQRAGADLEALFKDINTFCNMIEKAAKSISKKILEVIALNGFFNNADTSSQEEYLNKIVSYFKRIETLAQVSWDGEIKDNVSYIYRIERGVKEVFSFDKNVITAYEATKIAQVVENIASLFTHTVEIERQGKKFSCNLPSEFMTHIFEIAKKGCYIQRFKGLGEMNADQLWDTTLNPDTRTLLRVKVEDFDQAEEVFSVLMGDVVEPRKLFIQENALKVENLDA
jgi:DNA gyrase subunit B